MPQKTATLIGATGLVGSCILDCLKKQKEYSIIRLLVRHPVPLNHSKIEVKLVNFQDPESFKLAIDGSDVVFCTVGTTNKKVQGDKTAYRKVDYDIPVHAAQYCEETKCPQFLLVSAAGADFKSNNFYLKLKGEVEEAVKSFGIKSTSFFRPSILLGNRKESRFGERIAQSVAQFFSFFLVGRLEKYRPIDALQVAQAMVQAAKDNKPGVEVYDFTEMRYLVKDMGLEKV